MNGGRPFLLGFFSVAGQVLLLRELVATFSGDELFIGSALFGWLLSVAIGAGIAGRVKTPPHVGRGFVVGALVLIGMVPAVRFSPRLISEVTFQVIPFGAAALLSILAMMPVGLISGWLFSAITREGWHTQDSIKRVYLWDGVGAFVGGMIISLTISAVPSNLTLVAMVAVTTIAFVVFTRRVHSVFGTLLFVVATVVGLVAVSFAATFGEHKAAEAWYRPYRVEASFDTPYSRQLILSRDSLTVLVTDNRVEGLAPDPAGAEMTLIPPLLYRPQASRLLYFGRSEFGVADLAKHFPDITVTAVDPRRRLDAACDYLLGTSSGGIRVTDDPLSFINRRAGRDLFDIVVVGVGEPDNYKTGRLLTSEFFGQARRLLKENGLLVVLTKYDTDRYVTKQVAALTGTIYNSLLTCFGRIVVWPGDQTMFMAGDSAEAIPGGAEIIGRLDSLAYRPVCLDESILYDRLSDYKVERLVESFRDIDAVNRVERPVLPNMQAVYRSSSAIAQFVLGDKIATPYRVLITLLLPLLVLGCGVLPRPKRGRFGLYLYMTAGMVSISLELLSFYVFQTTAGTLYAELAALVGAFMLGLAGGTYYARRLHTRYLEYPALIVLLFAVVMFLLTWNRIDWRVALPYHLLFLFVVALATGSLFVAATDRYYENRPLANRGVGYAVELVGSAVGALFTLTVLLPTLGITGLLVLLAAVLIAGLVGAVFTERCY